MNTNNPDILFFVRREYGAPSIELRAYKAVSYTHLDVYKRQLCLFFAVMRSLTDIPICSWE